ncbi:MAG: hypothetical protein QOK44_4787 [Betaproteobacteria bacterium]|nr:hypothetical protein [Betaproteobacteria bacterium]
MLSCFSRIDGNAASYYVTQAFEARAPRLTCAHQTGSHGSMIGAEQSRRTSSSRCVFERSLIISNREVLSSILVHARRSRMAARTGITIAACALSLPAVAVVNAASDVSALSFPAKPIRVIVPTSPGGGVDIVARAIGQRLTESWGQPVVIDNRSGAAGTIGAELAGVPHPTGIRC